MMHTETQIKDGFFGAGCNSLPAVQSAKKCFGISRSGAIPEPTVNGDTPKSGCEKSNRDPCKRA